MNTSDTKDQLVNQRYGGIIPLGRTADQRLRLQEYLDMQDETFNVMGAYINHKSKAYGTNISDHYTVIDMIAPYDGVPMFITFRSFDKGLGPISVADLLQMVTDIVAYAATKNVPIIYYPHELNMIETVSEGLELVNLIDEPNFGIAFNLYHELNAGQTTEQIVASWEAAKQSGKLWSVNLAGADDTSNFISFADNTLDMSPLLKLISEDYEGRIGFMNGKLSTAADYADNVAAWNTLSTTGQYKLCEEDLVDSLQAMSPTSTPTVLPASTQSCGGETTPFEEAPCKRFAPWSTLSKHEKKIAKKTLNYKKSKWNCGSSKLEKKPWFDMNKTKRNALTQKFGFAEDGGQWDCWMNHYTSYKWEDMEEEGVACYWEALGWTKHMWDNGKKGPRSMHKDWDELSRSERAAAQVLCYTQSTWEEDKCLGDEGYTSPCT